MNSNAQKTPIARELNVFALKKAQSAIQLLGKALAASVVKVDPTVGSPIVTVKFEIQSPFTLPNVTVPCAGSEYVRLPLREASGDTPGTKGVVFPCDCFLGAISGLGSGTATLVQPGNLSALVFFPIGNLKWAAPDSKDELELYGEPGVRIKTKDGTVYIKVTETGIEIKGDVHFLGNVTIDKQLTSGDTTSLAGGAKLVVLDGDPVSGGAVHSSATKTKAT